MARAKGVGSESAVSRGPFRGFGFPIAVWATWRLGYLAALALIGGRPSDDAFRFDGGWFLSILQDGYEVADTTFHSQQNVAFFPGLHWVTEPFSWVVGDRPAALVVLHLTSLAAFAFVFGAMRAVTDERSARVCVVILAVWPASIVMTAYYSEGLFIAATAAAIWGAAEDRTGATALASIVAAVTRSIGCLLGPVLALARIARLRKVDTAAVAYALSGPVGIVAVATFQYWAVGDATAFAESQRAWDRQLSAPWTPLTRAGQGIIDKFPHAALELSVNLVSIVVVGAGLVVLWRYAWRRASLRGAALWATVAWFAPLWTAVPSSQIRFAMASWPAALSVAGDSRASRVARILVCIGGVGISMVAAWRWAHDLFIG